MQWVYSFIKASFYKLLLLIAIVLSLLLFLLTTTPGLYTVIKLANLVSPGRISAQGIHGQLIDDISFSQLTYQDADMTIALKSVHLRWHLRDLIHQQINFQHLHAKELSIRINDSTSDDEPLSFPQLPFTLLFEHSTIKQLTLDLGNTSQVFNNLTLSAKLMPAQWQVEELSFDYHQQSMRLLGYLDTQLPYQLDAIIQLKPLKAPFLEGNIKLFGNFSRYEWQANFTSPLSVNLQGELKQGSILYSLLQWTKADNPLPHQGELTIQGPLNQLTLNGKAQLAAPNAGVVTVNAHTSFNQVDVTAHLDSSLAKVDASINYHDQRIKAIFNAANNQIKLEGGETSPWKINVLLPEPAKLYPGLEGLLTKITASGEFTNQQGRLDLQVAPGSFKLPEGDLMTFQGGKLSLNLQKQQLKADGYFDIDSNKKIVFSCSLTHFDPAALDLNQPANCEASLAMNSLAFLKTINPLITDIQGSLIAKLALNGSLLKPQIEGTLKLSHGKLEMAKLGLNITPIEASLTSLNNHWQGQAQLMSLGKPLTLSGKGDFSPSLNGKLSLLGDDVHIINSPEYSLHTSPNLSLEFAPDLFKLRGRLLIPSALLKPQTFSSSVTISDDVVFVDEETPPDNPLNLDMDVDVAMGEHVELSIQGLNGFLTGNMQLKQLPKQMLSATGELSIRDGKYKAYGQNLTIEKGQLLFTGGTISNPGINLRAVRQFNNVGNQLSGTNQLFDFDAANAQTVDFGNKTSVGIEVSGRLKAPKVQLFSMPATLSQADILSMLLLGKPASQANQAGGQLLLAAVSALNMGSNSNGMQLLDQIKQNLGIDFNVESSSQYNQKNNQSSDSTAVVVGKSLSKRVYVSYNVPLSQADSNVLTLKYLLNKFFSIQVNASVTGSGIDLLYTRDSSR